MCLSVCLSLWSTTHTSFKNIGILISDTLPQVILEVMKFLDIGLKIPATLHPFITEVMDVGQV